MFNKKKKNSNRGMTMMMDMEYENRTGNDDEDMKDIHEDRIDAVHLKKNKQQRDNIFSTDSRIDPGIQADFVFRSGNSILDMKSIVEENKKAREDVYSLQHDGSLGYHDGGVENGDADSHDDKENKKEGENGEDHQREEAEVDMNEVFRNRKMDRMIEEHIDGKRSRLFLQPVHDRLEDILISDISNKRISMGVVAEDRQHNQGMESRLEDVVYDEEYEAYERDVVKRAHKNSKQY